MGRKVFTALLVVSLAGGIAPAAEAKKKARPRPLTYYMNWVGDCSGSGLLAVKFVANPDDCALFFPGLASEHVFVGPAASPFRLDASREVAVDFELTHVAQVAAEFEVELTAVVGGDTKTVATGTQTILAASVGRTPVHYDLEPDKALDGKTLEGLSLTVSWTSGVSYSSIDLQNGSGAVVLGTIR
ncbi:MAG: hypothetical protein M3279_05315 [Actinomycetota bacterium]|nr:hypothetical protein [Actinomycetota bacterium]